MKILLILLISILAFAVPSEAQLKAPIDLRMDTHANVHIYQAIGQDVEPSLYSYSMGVAVDGIGVYIHKIGSGDVDFLWFEQNRERPNLWAVGGTYDIFRRSTLSVGYSIDTNGRDKGAEFGFAQRISIIDFFDASLTIGYNSVVKRLRLGLGLNFNILSN